jgi:hypothetical protein
MSLVLLGGETLGELQVRVDRTEAPSHDHIRLQAAGIVLLQDWVQEIFKGLPTGKGPRPAFKDMGLPFQVMSLQ